MKNIAIVLLTSFLLSTPCLAHGPKLYFEESSGFFSTPQVTDGKTAVRPGFAHKYDLSKWAEGNPTALEYLDEHRTHANLSLIGVPFSVAGIFGLAYDIVDDDNDSVIGLVSLLAILGGGLFTDYHQTKSRAYLFRAVNEINGVQSPTALKAKKDPQFALSFNF